MDIFLKSVTLTPLPSKIPQFLPWRNRLAPARLWMTRSYQKQVAVFEKEDKDVNPLWKKESL